MTDWYAKARDTLTARGSKSREPVPFSRLCSCGETIAGERSFEPQWLECAGCGREWFILPRDPYPANRARRRAKSSAPKRPAWLRRKSSKPAAPAVSNDTDATGTDTAEFPIAAAVSRGKGSLRQTGDRSATQADGPVREGFRQRIHDAIRKEARPIRLVLGGVLAAIVLTGFWLWHRSRIDEASATIVRALPQAEAALQERDLATAEQRFAEAVAAVDLLGADDATANRIRQRHTELVALNHLSGKTPFDLAVEAGLHKSNPATWESGFEASYRGRWVVFDVPPGEARPSTKTRPNDDDQAADGPKPPSQVIPIDLALTAGSTPVIFEIDARLFQKLGSPQRVVFAAQYESWRHHSTDGGSGVWIVRFHPETAFLWSSPDTLATLGFDVDDPDVPLREVLKQQSKVLGVPWEAEQKTEPITSKP